jgi:hypothetical protein
MEILCIADSLGRHDPLRVPAGDAIIHAADFTEVGEVDLFFDWLAGFPSPSLPRAR